MFSVISPVNFRITFLQRHKSKYHPPGILFSCTQSFADVLRTNISPDRDLAYVRKALISPDKGSAYVRKALISPDKGSAYIRKALISPDKGYAYVLKALISPDKGCAYIRKAKILPDIDSVYIRKAVISPDEGSACHPAARMGIPEREVLIISTPDYRWLCKTAACNYFSGKKVWR